MMVAASEVTKIRPRWLITSFFLPIVPIRLYSRGGGENTYRLDRNWNVLDQTAPLQPGYYATPRLPGPAITTERQLV
jgi:hypothetical protein